MKTDAADQILWCLKFVTHRFYLPICPIPLHRELIILIMTAIMIHGLFLILKFSLMPFSKYMTVGADLSTERMISQGILLKVRPCRVSLYQWMPTILYWI